MADLAALALLVLLAAVVGEGTIEFLVAPLVRMWIRSEDDVAREARTIVLNSLSGVLGVLIAFTFNLGLFTALGGEARWAEIDLVLTGVMIGRGSNYAHVLLKRFMTQTNILDTLATDLV